jgi:phosphate acetyltransferase
MAAASRRRIVLSEATDPRVFTAGIRALDFCDVTMVCRDGNERDAVAKLAKEEGMADRLGKIDVVTAPEHPHFGAFSKNLEMRRAGKKIPDTTAPLNFANMLVSEKQVCGHVSGAVHTSGDVVKSAVQIVGLAGGISKVSSFFIFLKDSRKEPLIYADCAVNVNPTSQEMAEIAALSAASCKALYPDKEPKIAFCSFSTKGSAAGPEVQKVQDALAIFKEGNPSALADGEMQIDAALLESVGKKKAPGSPVAGQANVLIFPNLDSGNMCYKITERLAGFAATGPILQGMASPCNDLSRGCSSQDVEDAMVITALQAIAAGARVAP